MTMQLRLRRHLPLLIGKVQEWGCALCDGNSLHHQRNRLPLVPHQRHQHLRPRHRRCQLQRRCQFQVHLGANCANEHNRAQGPNRLGFDLCAIKQSRLDRALVSAGFRNATQAAPCPSYRMLGDAQYHCQLDEACAGVVKVPQGDFPYQLRAFENNSRAMHEERGTQYWHCMISSNWRTGCYGCVGLFGPCQRHFGTIDDMCRWSRHTQCPKGQWVSALSPSTVLQ